MCSECGSEVQNLVNPLDRKCGSVLSNTIGSPCTETIVVFFFMFIYFLYGQVSLDLESLYFKPQFSSLFSHAGSANLLSAGGTLAQVPRSPVSSGDASPPHVLVEGALLRCWNMSTGASFSEARDS